MSIAWLLPFDDPKARSSLQKLQDDILTRTSRAVDEAIRDNALGVAEFGWSADATLNARVARREPDLATVNVNVGTMSRLYAVFMALLSDPQFLPDLPFPECRPDLIDFAYTLVKGHLLRDEAFNILEDDDQGVIVSRSRFDGAVQGHGQDTLLLFLAPDNERRSRAALALANLALDFVLWHEIAHAARGHLELLPAGTLQILEVAPSEAIVESGVLHLLEHDADTCAALSLARSVIEDGQGFAWANLTDVLDGHDTVMSYITLSLCVLLVMFEAVSQTASSHPTPALRFWNLHDKLHAYFSLTLPDGAQRWERASARALAEIDQLAERLGYEGARFAESRLGLIAEVRNLDQALERISSKLRSFENMDRMRSAVIGRSRAD